jgi:hypothetical protein
MGDLIDEIEGIRRRNNVLWCQLLRIAFERAPTETKAIMKTININDRQISSLLERLTNEPQV